MQFAKLLDISDVDFGISGPHYYKQDQNTTTNQQLTLHTGATAWAMPQWKGEVYPSKCKSTDFLHHYSQAFSTVELNSSFYTIPKKEQIRKWYEQTQSNFKFCPKVNRSISQSKNLGILSDNLNTYIQSIVEFKEKLGPCFMQLPEYFDVKSMAILENFLQKWSKDIQLAVELRHSSWFENSDIKEQLLELFDQHQQSILMTDVAGFREGVHHIISEDYVLIRWVGNDLHPSDYQRLDEWLSVLDRYRQHGVKDVYFLIHEPNNVLSHKISLYLSQKCLNLNNIKFKSIVKNISDQLTLF